MNGKINAGLFDDLFRQYLSSVPEKPERKTSFTQYLHVSSILNTVYHAENTYVSIFQFF